MELMFIGADHEVTGSCHFLQIGDKNLLVDYGMEQGVNVFENAELPVAPAQIDYVLITHAHVDHTGLLPLLYAKGFRGQIFATYATADLCSIMLRDCAHIQMAEVEWKNRKAKRTAQKQVIEPLYTLEDADGAIRLFVPCQYDEIIQVCNEIQIRFTDIGHLLGSSSIEVWAKESGISKKIVFSGDIGNINQPLIKDPTPTASADYVVMESTYGDRTHGVNEHPDFAGDLAQVLRETFARGGNVVIPSFAVGRTQEVLYFIRLIKENDLLPEYPNFPVYMDSPLAVEATQIFQLNMSSCFDEEAKALVSRGVNPIAFPRLTRAITSDESKMINDNPEPKVIISASGMCEAGRIRHHLKHNLWRPECTILFVGYQANGTLGRALVEGAEEVKLFGETIQVNARIKQLPGLSGHADVEGLLKWAAGFTIPPQKYFIVHGEDLVCQAFADRLSKEQKVDTYAPYSGTRFDLITGRFIVEAKPIPVKKETKSSIAAGVYARLIAAGQRLMTVIKHNEGGANKDLAKFADQINALCDKWDR